VFIEKGAPVSGASVADNDADEDTRFNR
jgi:hypothetical protein